MTDVEIFFTTYNILYVFDLILVLRLRNVTGAYAYVFVVRFDITEVFPTTGLTPLN